LQNKKFCVLLLVLVIFAGMFFFPTFSSLMNSAVIRSSGQISNSYVTAISGSPADLQSAVDLVFARGGGTVYVPTGYWTFNPPAGGVGVTVPPGVNLVGAGKGKTRLVETVESIDSTMIRADGMLIQMQGGYAPPPDQQLPVRVIGISFIGFVPSRADADSVTNNRGLLMHCIKDFMVYDCEFSNFVNMGFGADNNDGWAGGRGYIMRGVVSHCSFDNPYKDDLVIQNRVWGYGIIVSGTGYWSPTVRSLLGHYVNNVVYIEDCDFRRCRHSIASTGGSFYVSRHNHFTEMIQSFMGSYIDAHAYSIGVEIYDNVIQNSPTDYRTILTPPEQYYGQYLGVGIGMRGGSGVIYNNIINKTIQGIQFHNDLPNDPDLRIQDFYVWNNTYIPSPQGSPESDVIVTGENCVLDRDYFLRAPNQEQDGFTYTPYPYPHPLVASLSP
jgi:hypothetical protein